MSIQFDVRIESEDVADEAVGMVRAAALDFGFSLLDVSLLLSATSELATNVLRHAGGGELSVRPTPNGRGLALSVRDEGPGIEDIDQASIDGVSTHPEGLGVGLGAIQRAAHEFEIRCPTTGGTHAEVRRYLPLGREHVALGTCLADRPTTGELTGATFMREVRGEGLLYGVVTPRTEQAQSDELRRVVETWSTHGTSCEPAELLSKLVPTHGLPCWDAALIYVDASGGTYASHGASGVIFDADGLAPDAHKGDTLRHGQIPTGARRALCYAGATNDRPARLADPRDADLLAEAFVMHHARPGTEFRCAATIRGQRWL